MDSNTHFLSSCRDVDNDNLAVTTTGNELTFETAANSGTETLVSIQDRYILNILLT